MPVRSNQDPSRRRRFSPRRPLVALLLAGALVVIVAVAALAAENGKPALGTVTGLVVAGPLFPVDPVSPVGWSPTQAEVLAYRTGTGTLVSSTRSDAAGQYTLRLAAGRYRLTARPGGAAQQKPVAVEVTVTAGDSQTVRILLDTGVRFSPDEGVVCTTPPAGDQGISGTVQIGPTRPVSTPGQPNSRPYAARIGIFHLDGTPAATVTSDTHGAFSATLAPGTYIVQPGARGPVFPRAVPFSITIEKGQWRCVTIVYDSGIR
jgi:hypothetical protein